MERRSSLALAAAVLLLILPSSGSGASGWDRRALHSPLIGVDYSHYRYPRCGLDDGGIVVDYGKPGVRKAVQRQLAAMRAAGIATLRLLLWHVTEATGMRWGVVSSAGGALGYPERSNLVKYLSDVRRAGFRQLTLVFAPEGANMPLGGFYDPSKFDENWQFVRDVRPLLKRYGPSSTRIDLINEGAPPWWESPAVIAEAEEYIAKIWRKYVDAFGGKDASFSSVGADGPGDTAARVQNLIDALRASGRPLPRWFDVHPPYDHDGMLEVLHAVDDTLTENGLSQPLVIGETAYDDPGVAAAIKEFEAGSSRRILDVMEWPGRVGNPCPPSPPFEANAYLDALRGGTPVMRLSATVSPRGRVVLRTSSGKTVTAVESGRYTVAVVDRSRKDDLHLVGPGLDRRSGLRFEGTASWTVDLAAGTYRYRSDRSRRRHGSFVVLPAG